MLFVAKGKGQGIGWGCEYISLYFLLQVLIAFSMWITNADVLLITHSFLVL